MKFPTASCLAVDLYLLTLVCLFLFFHFEDSPFWLTFSILQLYNLKWQLCIYMFTFQGTKKLDPCYEYLIEKKILAKIGLGHQKHIYENKILTKIGLRQQKSIYDPETYVWIFYMVHDFIRLLGRVTNFWCHHGGTDSCGWINILRWVCAPEDTRYIWKRENNVSSQFSLETQALGPIMYGYILRVKSPHGFADFFLLVQNFYEIKLQKVRDQWFCFICAIIDISHSVL